MKIYYGVTLFVCMGTSLFGYHKFRCMDCLLTGQEKPSSLGQAFVATPSISVSKAAYVLVDRHGISTSYVYLTALDKRAIAKHLKECDTKTVITNQLIESYIHPSWRRRHVVGLVLQDFRSMKPTATVGDVLRALKV